MTSCRCTPSTWTRDYTDGTDVTAVNILHGYEQELVAREADGDLVIHDLLVKDYPIIVRVSRIERVFLPVVLRGHSG